ncbi:hypothetical protein DOY81_006057 [Sarcophaga bullata]|nr:hypothetical protein DOY81_006057 [Sarcophaga bullata]
MNGSRTHLSKTDITALKTIKKQSKAAEENIIVNHTKLERQVFDVDAGAIKFILLKKNKNNS